MHPRLKLYVGGMAFRASVRSRSCKVLLFLELRAAGLGGFFPSAASIPQPCSTCISYQSMLNVSSRNCETLALTSRSLRWQSRRSHVPGSASMQDASSGSSAWEVREVTVWIRTWVVLTSALRTRTIQDRRAVFCFLQFRAMLTMLGGSSKNVKPSPTAASPVCLEAGTR